MIQEFGRLFDPLQDRFKVYGKEVIEAFTSKELEKLIGKATIDNQEDYSKLAREVIQLPEVKRVMYYHKENKKLARLSYFYETKKKRVVVVSIDEEGYVVAFFSPREQWNYINAIDKKDKKRIFAEAIPLDEFPVKIIH